MAQSSAARALDGAIGSLPCADDPELWYGDGSDADVEAAKEGCHGCSIRYACLSGALQRREPGGVWGGELFLRGNISAGGAGRLSISAQATRFIGSSQSWRIPILAASAARGQGKCRPTTEHGTTALSPRPTSTEHSSCWRATAG